MHACAFTVQQLHGGVACASPKIPCIAWRCVDAAFARVARAVRAMASALLACAWPRLRVRAGRRKRVCVQKNEGLAENLNAAPLCPSRKMAVTLGSDVRQKGVRVPCEA